jgi:4-hydroxy-tetrahydrodipicolinate reductase
VTTLGVAVAGASGRMGQVLIAAVNAAPDLDLRGTLDLGSDLDAGLAGADVLIDFTRPDGTMAHVEACRVRGVKMVIGTTGFSDAQKAEIGHAAASIAIVMAPNMSVGVNVVMTLVEQAARSLGPAFDVEIVETHHRLKVDAPSGTALGIGEAAARGLGLSLAEAAVRDRDGEPRRAGTIGFASLRGGDVVGDHTALFAGTGERIEITHRATSRATYADGSLRAARFLAGREAGLFGMAEVLGLAGSAR